MANIQAGQLTILAEKLSKIEEDLKKLKELQDKYRFEAHNLLIEGKMNNFPTPYGKFTNCSGKKTKIYTCPKVIKAEKALKTAKANAEANKLFTLKQGEDFLRFDPTPST